MFAVFLGGYYAYLHFRPDPCKPLLAPGHVPTESELRACIGDAEFDRRYDEYKAGALVEREALLRETAPWFGTTGLEAETERHIAEYVRMEFGERLGDEGALRASDLHYIGAFPEEGGVAHYWRIPGSDENLYVYVQVGADGSESTGLGGRTPPSANAP